MPTARQIITDALVVSTITGSGITPSSEEINDGLTALKRMLASWQRRRWLVYHLVDLAFVSNGAQYYTVGPAGNFNTSPRPAKLSAAYARLLSTTSPNQVDYPLTLLFSREDYSQIALKQLGSFPSFVFYDSDWPTAKLYVWPVPQASNYEIHIVVPQVLQQLDNLSEDLEFPPEYEEGILYNLAERLCINANRAVPEDVKRLAVAGNQAIKIANAQIAALRIPSALVRARIYNPYSDQAY